MVSVSGLVIHRALVLRSPNGLMIHAGVVILCFFVRIDQVVFVPDPVAKRVREESRVNVSIFRLNGRFSRSVGRFMLIRHIFGGRVVTIVRVIPIRVLRNGRTMVLIRSAPGHLRVVAKEQIVFYHFLTARRGRGARRGRRELRGSWVFGDVHFYASVTHSSAIYLQGGRALSRTQSWAG